MVQAYIDMNIEIRKKAKNNFDKDNFRQQIEKRSCLAAEPKNHKTK